ncbi:hypothetical protein [Rhizobium leguminosarum]|uniref:hypothetical protein n=1 Tax=Rhizobium leguminosarum TaxID=384 RepID=UPI0001665FE0|nr:hypothetical protein [Rhizobium leguminosarum]
MKFDTVKIVTREEFLEYLFGKVEENHKESRTGGKYGGIRVTADKYGIPEAELSNTLSGYRSPSRRLLDAEGLEKKVVYVRKSKEGR